MYFQSLQTCVKDRGPAPLVTWLSDVGRIELSATTFNNAVSKASNFLIDGLEIEEDSSLFVDLGNHWQAPVWLGTALAVGLKIIDQDPAVTFGTKSQAQTWRGSPEEFVVVSQDPFGMPDKEIPVGFVNGSAEVRNFGDYFAPSWSIESDAHVLQSKSQGFTWDQLVRHALELAENYGIKSGQSYGLHGASDLVTTAALQVVLPVTNKNSVVLIDQKHPDLDAIKNQEKLEQIVLLD
jgi:uncharacterized protein (TIGR03089 family)